MEINDETFDEEIMKSDIPAVVDFWAEWCMPCKVMGPIIDELASELSGKIKVCKINIDENTKMATDLTVMNIPTILFFEGGEEKGRVTGAVSKKDLLSKVSEFLKV
ncbi:MAG: thioredoxin [Candidatus Omnitrophica bacterium]|nr:thioredoxin [Candidatus Omnitrophota bacterium]